MAFDRKNDSNVTIIDADDIDHEGKYKETPVTEADRALEDFLDKARAIGSAATLTINKISSGRNSSEIFCGKFPVDKYDYFDLLSLIQSNWGEGDYRIYCTVKGKKGVLQNTLVSVAPPPNAGLQQQSNPATSGDQILQTVIKMMQENNERLIEAMTPKQNDGEDATTKVLNQMLLFKQVMGGDDKKTSTLSTVKEMVEVMALMKGLSGESASAEPSALMSALTAFAPVAAAAVGAMANRQPQQVPQYRHNPPPVQPRQETVVNEPIINETIINPEPEVKNKMDAHAAAINGLITMLDTLGANAVDPALIAEKITVDIDDEQLDALGEWLSSDTCFKDLVTLNPRVANYPEWFADLIEHIKAQIGIVSKVDHLYDLDNTDQPDNPIEHTS